MPVQLLNIQVNTSQRWRSCFIDASNCRPIYRFQLGNWNQDATGVVGTCRRPPRHPRHGVGSKLVCAISGWEMSICDFWFGLRVKLSQRMMHNVAFGCLPQVCDGIWVIDAVLSIIFYFNDSSVTPQWCNQRRDFDFWFPLQIIKNQESSLLDVTAFQFRNWHCADRLS